MNALLWMGLCLTIPAVAQKTSWADPPYRPLSEQIPNSIGSLPLFGTIEWTLDRLPFVPPGPQGGISGQAMTAVGDAVFMAGGYIPAGDETSDRASRETARTAFRYVPQTQTWTQLPNLPARREYPRGLSDGRYFYVVGGGVQMRGLPVHWQVASDCYRIDTLKPGSSWEGCGSLTVPRSHMAVGRVGRFLIVAGGAQFDYSQKDPYVRRGTTDVLDLDHPNRGWSVRASIPGVPRAWSAGASCNGRLYMIGGLGPVWTEPVFDTLSYDPEKDHWERRAPAPIAAEGWEAGCFANRYVIVTGGTQHRESGIFWSDLALAYDTKEDRWLRIDGAIPGGAVINDVGIALIGDSIFAAGAEGPKGTHFYWLRIGRIRPAAGLRD